ncbi:MAG: sulfotransferase, partial [Pseudomonadales bacterium]
AEARLRAHLRESPTDVAALRMFAEVAARLGRQEDAEHLLERCLELAPGFDAARQNYALVLYRSNKPEAALAEIATLLAIEPRNPGYRNLKAIVLGHIGEYTQAIELFGELLAEYPGSAKVWMSYGHALKTAGDTEQSVVAYRKCIALEPGLGEAWWSLANLKTLRFDAADLAAMRAALAREDLADEDRLHFEFAIGKALEDGAEYADSFAHYAEGNRVRRAGIHYSADATSARVQRTLETFTADFFATRAGFGCAARDPIFVVGLPRSGSTLIEQILSSHSAVEGTMELPEIRALGDMLRERAEGGDSYHAALAAMDAAQLGTLGESYLERTRIQRKTAAPFFIDKMPNNIMHLGLIHQILPNARIIDARRHPMACCFSGFKQHFARGQHFSYSLPDIGRYYADYVRLMAHFDAVLPRRVHRVFYERMVGDTEVEVRRLLDYCGLPFEAGCLRFFENERPVRTASSEQVRQPIYTGGG